MEYENNLTKNYIPFIVLFCPPPPNKNYSQCDGDMLHLHRKGFGSTFQFSDCMSSSNLQKSSAVLPGMCILLPVEKLSRLLSLLTTACTSTSFSTRKFMLFSTSSLLFWSCSLAKWALKFFSSINNMTAGPHIKKIHRIYTANNICYMKKQMNSSLSQCSENGVSVSLKKVKLWLTVQSSASRLVLWEASEVVCSREFHILLPLTSWKGTASSFSNGYSIIFEI